MPLVVNYTGIHTILRIGIKMYPSHVQYYVLRQTKEVQIVLLEILEAKLLLQQLSQADS